MLAFPVRAGCWPPASRRPLSAIAQLGAASTTPAGGGLGRVTLWLTLLYRRRPHAGHHGARRAARHRHPAGQQHADRRRGSGAVRQATRHMFALFQAASAVFLLVVASSSFQAGPGLLKALARADRLGGSSVGVLPTWMGRTNRHHTPYWAGLIYLLVSAAVIVAWAALATRSWCCSTRSPSSSASLPACWRC